MNKINQFLILLTFLSAAWSPIVHSDCDSVLRHGAVKTFNQENNIESIYAFKNWVNEVKNNNNCAQFGYGYTNPLENENITGSICDKTSNSFKQLTSTDQSYRDKSKTEIWTINNAAISAWENCMNDDSQGGVKYSYKLYPEDNRVDLVFKYHAELNAVNNTVNVTLSNLKNISCHIQQFNDVDSLQKLTNCSIEKPYENSFVTLTFQGSHTQINTLHIPKFKPNPDNIIWPYSIFCGIKSNVEPAGSVKEFIHHVSEYQINHNYLYHGLDADKDSANIVFLPNGKATSLILDQSYNPTHDTNFDRRPQGFVDYYEHGCANIFVEYLPHR